MARRMVFFLLLTLALTSCTPNPFTTDNTYSGDPRGPAIGAGVGAGSALLAGASKPMLAVSTMGGAALGYYVTTLRFASGGVIQSGGKVFDLGDYLTIEIPTDQLFDTNSDEFLNTAAPILNSALAVLKRYPNSNILVSGNTSGFSTAKFERKLSENRARQVASYLWLHGISDFQEQSIQTRKLNYVGYGNYFPVANNIRNEGIRQNSRIQITAYPTKDQLEMDKQHKIFNNIGELPKPVSQPAKPPVDFSDVFPQEENKPSYKDDKAFSTRKRPHYKGE